MNDHLIHINAAPVYLSEQSFPEEGIYFFSYTITISNLGPIAAQVIARNWTIIDANGLVEKVGGLGVVGHQPLLEPKQIFEYTSGVRLRTATGSLHGTLLVVTEEGVPMEVPIPRMELSTDFGAAFSVPPSSLLH